MAYYITRHGDFANLELDCWEVKPDRATPFGTPEAAETAIGGLNLDGAYVVRIPDMERI